MKWSKGFGAAANRAPVARDRDLTSLGQARRFLDAAYRTSLRLGFALFNGLRVVSYLPTLWAIHASGDSSQHSLWTWAVWFGANLTMAGWLFEQRQRRCDRAIALMLCNAAMCAASIALIMACR